MNELMRDFLSKIIVVEAKGSGLDMTTILTYTDSKGQSQSKPASTLARMKKGSPGKKAYDQWVATQRATTAPTKKSPERIGSMGGVGRSRGSQHQATAGRGGKPGARRTKLPAPQDAVSDPSTTATDLAKSYAADERRSSVMGYTDRRGQARRLAQLDRAKALADREDSSLNDQQREAARGLHADTQRLLELQTKFSASKNQRERARIRKEMAKLAAEMMTKYGLHSNESGESFKASAVGSAERHIFGYKSGLAKDLVGIFAECGVDLRSQTDPDKATKNALQRVSKVSLEPPPAHSAANNPRVQELMDGLGADVPPAARTVFGPADENGRLLPNSGGENARAFFEHSLGAPALSDTSSALREAGREDMAQHVDQYQQDVQAVLDNPELWPTPDTEEARAARETAVTDAYKKMVMALDRLDPELTNSMLKNLAELSLYQQEIAAGKEAYLPGSGSFPVADKIVVRKDGTTGAERIASVSIKYDRSGRVFGMPAQSSGFMAYDKSEGRFYAGNCGDSGEEQLDEKKAKKPKVKRDCTPALTTGTPGRDGYALGVRDDVIDDDTAWGRVMTDSGLGEVLPPERQQAIRDASKKIKDCVTQTRSKGKKSHEAFKSCQEQHGDEMKRAIYGDPPDDLVASVIGRENAARMGNNPASFTAVAGTVGALRANDGFPNVEHCHQAIEGKRGSKDIKFDQHCEGGTSDITCWDITFRGSDARAGGVKLGYNSELCGGKK
jgi:hypothetical protein